MLGVQALGLAVVAVWGFSLTWLVLKLIQLFKPVRVTRDEELIGLDIGIHGVPAYSQDHDFLDVDQLRSNSNER